MKVGGKIPRNAIPLLRNIQDIFSDGKTPYERRFGQPFKETFVPFGSLVEYHFVIAKGQSRIHQFGKRDLPGLLTQRSLQKFLEPERKPKVINTDNSLEFGKACEDLSWNHCAFTPHRSETNEIAERAVRRVKEGTSVLLQSGLENKWWADSIE